MGTRNRFNTGGIAPCLAPGRPAAASTDYASNAVDCFKCVPSAAVFHEESLDNDPCARFKDGVLPAA